MTKQAAEKRPPHPRFASIYFVDDYVWERDAELNHRLVITKNGDASDWVPFNSMAVLNDRFIVTTFWQTFFPTEVLLRWEVNSFPLLPPV